MDTVSFNNERIILRAHLDLPWNRVDIIGHQEPKDNQIMVASDLIVTSIDQGSPVKPFLHLSLADAQLLIDDLWNSGLRPSNCKESGEMLATQKRHLDDMRAIVEHQMEIKFPCT